MSAAGLPGAAVQCIDVNSTESIREAVQPNLAAVIVCTAQSHPGIQRVSIERAVPCLDVAIEPGFVREVLSLDEAARDAGSPVVAMAGLWPGLSGLMAKHAASQFDEMESLDLALCQNARAQVGPTGIADMLRAFAQPATLNTETGPKRVPGFRIRRRVEYPKAFGPRYHRLVDFVEGPILADLLGVQRVNLWTGFNSVALDALASAFNRVGLLRLFNSPGVGAGMARLINASKRLGPTGPEPIAVVVEATGRRGGEMGSVRLALTGPSDYGVTSMCAVAMARLLADRENSRTGAAHPAHFFDLQGLVRTIDHPELVLAEGA